MKIYIQMKAAGKRKPVLDHVPYELPDHVSTLRGLLTELVRIEVERYNEKGTDVQVVPYLTKEEIGDQAEAGKVGFGRIYSEKRADVAKASENALQCFEDGLVRVFQNDQELQQLDLPVQIQEGDSFTLIRLTFLAGRLW
ncbi:MAG: hypothetical protein K2N46_00835 [Lachnospiraceae bacterium]|nr:hypothetical protein [Lachnospiraceae bacterium]